MAPTIRLIRDELENLLAYLINSEIALHCNPVSHDANRLTWRASVADTRFLANRGTTSLYQYRAWLEAGQYSALLFDGAMLQVSYDFVGHALVAHRLAWVPSPFSMDPELLEVFPLLEVFDTYAEGKPGDVVLHTTVRFDFDLERALPNHPAAHMSINSAECRIPCAAPLRLGHFIDFVFRNFYPVIWRAHPYLDSVSRTAWGPHTVTDVELERPHMSWSR